jgi:histidyl-tRNA synthetase
VQIGSITGGGRYDNLTGVFGVDGLSGVGISFGADRIYDVLNQLDLYPKTTVNQTQVIFLNFGEKEMEYCIPLLAQLRSAGISTEIYPDAVKFKKQMQYANDRNIPFVAIVGESEMAENVIMLKDMTTGNQEKVLINDIISKLAQ